MISLVVSDYKHVASDVTRHIAHFPFVINICIFIPAATNYQQLTFVVDKCC